MAKYVTRDAVLDVLAEVYGTVEGDAEDAIHKVWERVKELPDADVERPRWISVKERLPEHARDVLIFAIGKTDGFFGKLEIAITGIYNHKLFPSSPDRWEWSAPWQYFHSNYKITHWMPLPEPPKEENT